MKSPCLPSWMLAAATLSLSASAQVVLIDGPTQGFYNGSVLTVLNGTSPVFPVVGDPVMPTITTPPDLTPASSILGNWLTNPDSLNSNWSALQAIPTAWPIGAEDAIIYRIESPAPGGLLGLMIEIGVDNGAFVWFDGSYMTGQLLPGPAVLGEITVTVPTVAPGTHWLQILREDHGITNDYVIRVTASGTPVAATYGTGCPGAGAVTPSAGVNGLPRLGNPTFGLVVSQALPSTIALPLGSLTQASVPIGGSCQALIAPPFLNFGLQLTDLAGTATLPLGLPISAQLLGAQFFFQWAVVDSAGAALGFLSLSDGMEIVLGT
ncbi:MAG TPA: hypothetical protein VFZ65_15555 [Planctomycetota bacterium]|nr:hypothetical protein [Planctomycetota bacterium]